MNFAFYLWAVSFGYRDGSDPVFVIERSCGWFYGNNDCGRCLDCLLLAVLLGKTIGSVYNDRISGGQALGQKNTILAIWMAHTYLNPLSSVAPGSYVLWQKYINSWQLWKKRRKR